MSFTGMASGQNSSPDRIRHQWPDVVVFHLLAPPGFILTKTKKQKVELNSMLSGCKHRANNDSIFWRTIQLFWGFCSYMCILIINPANLLQDEDL